MGGNNRGLLPSLSSFEVRRRSPLPGFPSLVGPQTRDSCLFADSDSRGGWGKGRGGRVVSGSGEQAPSEAVSKGTWAGNSALGVSTSAWGFQSQTSSPFRKPVHLVPTCSGVGDSSLLEAHGRSLPTSMAWPESSQVVSAWGWMIGE